MARKKSITEVQINNLYISYILEHNETPKSVFNFSKLHNFEEADFYNFYASFDTIDVSIFKSFVLQTIALLENSEDYANYNSRNKLLSFYFTFFELLNANRSYIVSTFKRNNLKKTVKIHSAIRKEFITYVKTLDIDGLDLKHDKAQEYHDYFINETFWSQLLFTFKFWVNDDSKAFEKTDILIEKSVNTSFDILNTSALKSIVDLGKFLIKQAI